MTTLAEARAAYFETNGFGRDGGYRDRWVVVGRLGPVPLAFPNSAARVRAVRYHDLHHVVTGYATDLVGEAEIAAWELASGCADHRAAWLLNLSVLPVVAVRRRERDRLLRAFVRGTCSRNLYRERFDDALLARRIDDARAQLGLDRERDALPPATAAHRARFRRFVALGGLLNAMLLLIALTPLALLATSIAWVWAT